MRMCFGAGMRARSTLVWGALGFIVIQMAMNAAQEAWSPELHDPEFKLRLATLRQRLAEQPERRLLLVMGSSRLVTSFRPEILSPDDAAMPLVFNFAHFGAGPILNLVDLHRLLRKGVRPDWIVLEVMPPFLVDEGTSSLTTNTELGDLGVLLPYSPAGKLYGRFVRTRLLPCYQLRRMLWHELFPEFLSAADEREAVPVPVERLGGYPPELLASYELPREMARRTKEARSIYFPHLQQFHILPAADQALRETIALAQRSGTRIALLLTPEGSGFKAYYSPNAFATAEAYCQSLGRSYGVPVLNARDWLSDAEFVDGHHVTRLGAKRFTRRLERDVLRPLVKGGLSAAAP